MPRPRTILAFAGGAGIVAVLSPIRAWFLLEQQQLFGLTLPPFRFHAWSGPTTRWAAVLAVASLAWTGLRAGGVRAAPILAGALGVAGAALTGLGLAFPPATASGRAAPGWALYLALGASVAWAAGGVAAWREGSADAAHSGGGFSQP
jgi:hypothetical protein